MTPFRLHHGTSREKHQLGADGRVHPWYVPPRTLAAPSTTARPSFPPRQPKLTKNPKDRLYLAAYTQPPTADTLFPYGDQPAAPRTPSKRSPPQKRTPFYFSVDDSLLYNAFHHDFGPLHIGHLYRFALYFHDVLAAPENKDRPIVFWSAADPRSTLAVPSSPCPGQEGHPG
ncbi:hypothetical protein IMZ48_13130 [Candidatus Bathyarchaeota archaeon]|nr:hypothetical protein [Candidatus Bathyarchaeota archaeon]